MNKSKDFYTITNKEIYRKLLDIESQVKRTNGKVKINRWIATTALSTAFLVVGYCLATL